MIGSDWAYLRKVALEEVESTLRELPGPLKDRAGALAVTFEPRPNSDHCRDGIEPDTLGLFVGPEFAYEETSAMPIPPQIILFLENLWSFAEENEAAYCEEVRTTFMHELGHYLGLDEDDLFDRGLG